ncbi:hypothetical protein CQ018_12310 [Arthrobacter sp. MYb227]|uniref:hypothetical protein n=1 Tax=Arthrobacter sp. MYb227 TaxID=1848601 RepID=UPI000CFC40D6|nr:hypothetical protein [Arthrobacter sp. MYb227]PQZ92281.1 hypothetical protein CQ018_12310 [Arthrobacter sp. MYb227]
MSATPRTGDVTRQRKIHWLSSVSLLLTAALFLAASVLQQAASLQRWVTLVESEPENISFAEDHRYDYFFPSGSWVNYGSVTEQYSLAKFLLTLGMISLTFGVLAQTKGAPRQRILIEYVLSAVVVAWFGISSLHVILSGAIGSPSVLQYLGILGAIASFAGLALTVLWWGRAPAAAIGCLLLMGSTTVGYVIAFILIAPIFVGYTSHDTTPWAESVVAATTVAAALTALIASAMALRKQRA